MGRTHSLGWAMAPIARDPGVALVKAVLVDIDPDRAAQAAAALGWAESATDWRAVIAREDIDVIDIVTPPHLHAAIATAAIEAGKAVLCEKPITNDLDEALAVAALARRAGVTAQVGFNYRHSAAIRYIRHLLADGTLGVPLQFRSTYLDDCKFLVEDMGWRDSRSRGASGVLGDLGSHAIDAAEFLVGSIARVSATAMYLSAEGGEVRPSASSEHGDHADDGGIVLAQFANGAIGTFATSFHASGNKNRFTIALDCSRGSVEFDWNDRDVVRVSLVSDDPRRSGFTEVTLSEFHPDPWWEMGGLGSGYLETTTDQIASFARAVVAGQPGAPDFSAAAHVQHVVTAALTASASGSWVDVPEVDGADRG